MKSTKLVNLHISMTPFRNESRVLKQCGSLLKYNVVDQIYVVALHEDDLAIDEDISDKFNVHRVVLKSRKLPRFFLTQIITYLEFLYKVLRFSFRKKVSIVNVHSIALLPLGSLIKLFTRSKLIYDAHELETETDELRGFRKSLAKVVERVFISYTDGVVVVGEEIRKWYIEAYGCNNIVTVLNCPHYVVSLPNEQIRDELGIEKNKKIILYLGGISEGRGIKFLLNAFTELNSDRYALVLIGYGDLESLIRSYQVKNKNIYLRNPVKPNEVIKYASSADIGIHFIQNTCLNHYYCLPNKLFEYTMAGIPTIISDLPEMRRIVEKYEIGTTISVYDENDLGRALDYLNQNDSETIKEKLVIAAKDLNWESQEQHYIKLIKSTLA